MYKLNTNKTILLLLVGLFLSNFTWSQKLTPSEMRKQKQKEQEGNDSNGASDKKLTPSEKREQLKLNKSQIEVFGDDDPEFKMATIPDKWKNESAVVIYQKMSYSYLRDNNSVNIAEVVRRRVKLLDKAAVDNFSEFYFVSHGTEKSVGITIIKPDGKSNSVDTKDAKVVETNIPAFYQAYYTYFDIKYQKLAIPDLEVGDIIDYYYKTLRGISTATVETTFDPFIFTLASTYPIMSQKIDFTVDRGFFINFNSYNGAPQLKEGEAGIDAHGRKRALIKTYELYDKDREKLSKDIWNYHYCTAPTVKFQIVYESPSNIKNASTFIGEPGVAKNTVTHEDIQRLIGHQIGEEIGLTFSDDILKYLNKKCATITDPEKIAREAFYYFRYSILNYYYIDNAYVYTGNREEIISVDTYKFVSALLQVFKRKRIDAQAIVAVPRTRGSLNNLLLSNELVYGVRIKQKDGKDIYMFPFDNHSTFDLINERIEGAEAYGITPVRNPRILNLETIKLPSSTFQQNNINLSYDIAFDEIMENLKVKRKCILSGHIKEGKNVIALHTYNYLKDDVKKYDPTNKYLDEQVRGNKAKIAEEKRKKDDAKEEQIKNQKEVLKKDVESDFDVASYDSFELIEPGRYDDKPNLIYNEIFTLKNLINKVGKNYILDIGKLIGKQVELSEKDMKRDNDIYISYAKSLTNEITINLPAGYNAEGLTDLNFNIDNASASFISTAKQDGTKLIIKTQKNYKSNFEKKENWPNMVSALEAAYKFSQKKIILKKA